MVSVAYKGVPPPIFPKKERREESIQSPLHFKSFVSPLPRQLGKMFRCPWHKASIVVLLRPRRWDASPSQVAPPPPPPPNSSAFSHNSLILLSGARDIIRGEKFSLAQEPGHLYPGYKWTSQWLDIFMICTWIHSAGNAIIMLGYLCNGVV